MNPRSLHVRLAAWHAAWLAVVFVVAGILVFYGLRGYLGQHAAVVQRQRAERVDVLLGQGATGRKLADEIVIRWAPEATGRFLRIADDAGTVLYQSGTPLDHGFDPASFPPAPLREGTFRDEPEPGVSMVRVCIRSKAPAAAGKPGLWIESAESMAPALVELNRLLLSLGLAFALVAAVAVVGGTWLVRRALRDVQDIAGTADRISSRNLSERLPVPATGDEFEHLSRTLNRMIARLDEAFSHNRRFLADASHELRTPLTVLRGELENLAQERRIAPEFRERLGSALEEAEHLAGIVQGLFDLARLDAGEGNARRAPVDLARLAASTTEQMSLLADDKGVTLRCLAPGPAWVEGDRARLKQVVVNLVDNAIKYTPRGGHVTVSVARNHGHVTLDVADDGIGIPPESLAHVFDRFYRVDKARSRDLGGAGLGLSIVRSICAAHGGSVEAHSPGQEGTLLHVALPSCPPPPDAANASTE